MTTWEQEPMWNLQKFGITKNIFKFYWSQVNLEFSMSWYWDVSGSVWFCFIKWHHWSLSLNTHYTHFTVQIPKPCHPTSTNTTRSLWPRLHLWYLMECSDVTVHDSLLLLQKLKLITQKKDSVYKHQICYLWSILC